jgi:PilZ domain
LKRFNGEKRGDEAVHTQADHLELDALGELPEDLSSAIECHLKSCLADELAYFGPEKRKSPRVATDDRAVLTVLKPEQPARLRIRIVDASKEGLKLLAPLELMRGMIVQVHVHGFFILAEVRYCTPAGEGFHAGVQIQDVFRVAS